PYLGADNQTLRIMLTDADHFVWSLDNAAPLYRARISTTGGELGDPAAQVTVTLIVPPADEEHFPLAGRVVEILPFGALLDDTQTPTVPEGDDNRHHFNKAATEIGAFTRVTRSYDPGNKTFLVDATAPGVAQAAAFVHEWDGQHPDIHRLTAPLQPGEGVNDRFVYVRFWHTSTANDLSDIEIALDDEGVGPLLEPTAVQPTFTARGRRGDFWIATIRPETPDPILPVDLQATAGLPPDGPKHFYAPIGVVEYLAAQVTAIEDCRPLIRPTGDGDCSLVTVGDCFGSIGDFQTIAEGIAALPTDGGVVTIRPGLYGARGVSDRP